MATYLTGKFLIAMPQMTDTRFHQSLVYICGHDNQGAMGIVINRTIETHSLSELMNQLKLGNTPISLQKEPIFFGGPVEMGRGFILHSNDYHQEGTVNISPEIGLTASLDILEAIRQGAGPQQRLCALGYAGWSAGQLEGELQKNCWIQSEADSHILFKTKPKNKWSGALERMGIHPDRLSTDTGHA